jgi:hypothetical protein
MSITGTPNWALTVKGHRANFVHAPFPEILSSRLVAHWRKQFDTLTSQAEESARFRSR